MCSGVYLSALSKIIKGISNLSVARLEPEHEGYWFLNSKKEKRSMKNMELGVMPSYVINMLWSKLEKVSQNFVTYSLHFIM